MKKLFLIATMFVATLSINAQNEDLKHEIGVSYGIGVSTISDGIGNGVGRGIFENIMGYEWTNDKQFGSLAVEYFYHTNNPKLAVGGIITYAKYGEDVMKKENKNIVGERTRHYISVMPSVKYYWINKNHFGLYSKAAAGAMLLSEKSKDNEFNKEGSDSKLYFMGQVSPIGVEFGSKVRGFIEAGCGEQGIVLAGLKYKF